MVTKEEEFKYLTQLVHSGFHIMEKEHFRLIIDGICPCGGQLRTCEWTTKTHNKGRTTCNACGRTELKTEKRE
jgi:hypothetical protein